MNEKYIVDRIEENYAVVEKENGDMYRIAKDKIKGEFKDGDILINRGEYFEIDHTVTLNRRKEIEDITKDMWKE